MKLLRPDQAAVRLNIGKRTVYKLVSEGELPALKVRGSLRIPDHVIDQYISKQLQIYSYEQGLA